MTRTMCFSFASVLLRRWAASVLTRPLDVGRRDFLTTISAATQTQRWTPTALSRLSLDQAATLDRLDFARYPDPILRLEAKPVRRCDAALAKTVALLRAAARRHGAQGLAATQVRGVDAAHRIARRRGLREPPHRRAVARGPVTVLDGAVPRAAAGRPRGALRDEATVAATTAAGVPFTTTLTGAAARQFIHEYDHARGVLIIDHAYDAVASAAFPAMARLEAVPRRATAKRRGTEHNVACVLLRLQLHAQRPGRKSLHFALTRVGSTGRSRATRRGAASAAPATTSSSACAVRSRSAARLTPGNGPRVTTKPSSTASTTGGGGAEAAGSQAGRGGEGIAAGGDGTGPAGAAGAGRASGFRGAASDGAAPSRRGGSHTTTSVRDASVRFVPRRTGAVLGGCPSRRCGGGQCFKSLSTAVCA